MDEEITYCKNFCPQFVTWHGISIYHWSNFTKAIYDQIKTFEQLKYFLYILLIFFFLLINDLNPRTFRGIQIY